MTKGDLVLIEWLDAYSPPYSRWMDKDESDETFEDELTIRTVGWVYRVDEKYVLLVSSKSESDHVYQGHFGIPKGCIKKTKMLRKAKA